MKSVPTRARSVALARPLLGEPWREVALVLVVTLAYFLTRGLIRGQASDALLHARALLALEQMLHLDPEIAVQHLALAQPWLTTAANLMYLGAHLPVLIGVAIWLYWCHPGTYRVFRNAFALSALLGLSIYVIMPVAPPRFLPGFVDTLKTAGLGLDGSAIGLLYNPYAAMPSLHVGWALLAGIALVKCGRYGWQRAAGVALPLLMALAVLITGNHYLLDILAGTFMALVSQFGAEWWSRRSQASRRTRREAQMRKETHAVLPE
jgi:membrane-associated phospholipid phosphatase